MRQTLVFALPDGQEIEAEVADEPGLVTRGSQGDALPDKVVRGFAEAVSVLKPAATAMIETLRDAAEGTEAVTIKFGLKFSAHATLILAATAGEATLEVQIRWAPPKPGS